MESVEGIKIFKSTTPKYRETLVKKLSAKLASKKVKVKVTLVQALRLCTGRTAHRGSKGIALLFHDQLH